MTPNARISDALKIMWKEVVVTYFMMLYRHLSGRSEKKEESQSGRSMSGPIFEPVTS
jgi:hypothetical protein